MTQDSREALIELLFLSLYLDNHLSLAEDDVLNNALEALGWESQVPQQGFIFRAFASARDAADRGEKTDAFLTVRADQIKRDGDEATALTWLSKVLGSDGISPTEKYFLDRLQMRLYPGESVE